MNKRPVVLQLVVWLTVLLAVAWSYGVWRVFADFGIGVSDYLAMEINRPQAYALVGRMFLMPPLLLLGAWGIWRSREWACWLLVAVCPANVKLCLKKQDFAKAECCAAHKAGLRH